MLLIRTISCAKITLSRTQDQTSKTMSLHFLICLFSLLTFASATSVRTMPGCQSTCGNISIPYPFGIGDGCFGNENLKLRCRSTFTPPRLLYGRIPVRDISLSGTMTIAVWMSNDCYYENGTSSDYYIQNITLSDYFTLSNTRNKFTAIGCDTIAFMSDANLEGGTFRSGCVSLCGSIEDVDKESCTGIGCCQTAIPKGMKSLYLNLLSSSNHSTSWKFNPCSYAFLADTEVFKFSLSDFFDIKGGFGPDFLNDFKNETGYPVVLDWVVGLDSCEKITNNSTSYACGNNSDCVDSKHGLGYGYTCKCKEGYEGNPYFTDGCTDINECYPKSSCEKPSTCTNFPGSYHCSCPPGYTDQYSDGKNCIAKPKKLPILLLGLGLGAGVVLLMIVLAISYYMYGKLKSRRICKLKQKFFIKNGGLLLEQQASSGEGNSEKSKIFRTEELEKATDDFNENRVLGKGGSGTVYKGMLQDGRIVAIKKSKEVDETQVGQFINELVILADINHKNIVKVMGCCLETEVPLLVYEYVSRGTLSEHLHGENQISSMSWEDRLRIAREVAGALSYLHSSLSTPVFHRDIKSSNILLDENFRAKVSDFGISRSVPEEKTHLSTIVQGTFGYLDPEYFHSGQFTEKSDVYGFGVVLVELLTGQKAYSSSKSEDEKNLVTHFISLVKEERVFEVFETRIANEARKEDLQVVASLAKKCLKIVGKKRPTMKEVQFQLENLRMFQHQESLSLLSCESFET